MRRREVAKFASGMFAWETLGHAALAISNELPIKLFGFTLTPGLNAAVVVIAGTLTVALAYYGWRQPEIEPKVSVA